MIDERQQELASLYAFDLLEGAERVQFEADVARDPELQKLVAELREAGAKLALTAPPAEPPGELKARIMATAASRSAPGAVPANVVAFPSRSLFATLAPWAVAAGFAVCAAWYGGRYYVARSENARLNSEHELAAVALRAAETQLEMNRITTSRLAGDLTATEAKAQRELADAAKARTDVEQQLAQTERDRAALHAQLAAAEQAAAKAGADLVALNEQRRQESDLARLKIATLASMLQNSPKALAVAVWDPKQQQGVFTVSQLPASTAEQRYELWVIDKVPVSAGVFSVGADGHTKLDFKPTHPIQTAAKFAVSREKNDGLASHAAPAEVIMLSE